MVRAKCFRVKYVRRGRRRARACVLSLGGSERALAEAISSANPRREKVKSMSSEAKLAISFVVGLVMFYFAAKDEWALGKRLMRQARELGLDFS